MTMRSLVALTAWLRLQDKSEANSNVVFPLAMSSSHASSWFHIRLIYARLSGCCCCATTSRDAAAAAAPESLCLRFPPRSIGTALEVNGGRISPSEQTVLVLRREKRRRRRSDPESAEATFLSTDDVRTSGPLSFEILFKGEALVAGTITLEQQHSVFDSLQQQGGDDGVYNSSSLVQKSSIDGLRRWSLDCASVVVGHAGSIFSKLRRHDHNILCPSSSSSSSSLSPPAMEVCLVARNLGTPVILIQTVHLTAPRRRSSCRQSTLEAIPEAEEVAKRSNLMTMTITEQQPKLVSASKRHIMFCVVLSNSTGAQYVTLNIKSRMKKSHVMPVWLSKMVLPGIFGQLC
jgi:hypothetical protein